MIYTLPEPKDPPAYVVENALFNREECWWISNLAKLYPSKKGGTGTDNQITPDLRDSTITWIMRDTRSEWVYQIIEGFIVKFNAQHFGYDLKTFEALQFTEYGEGHLYDWHRDSMEGAQNNRKLSLSILIEPAEEGGIFEIMPYGTPNRVKQVAMARGGAVIFSSYLPHRVTPVTKGLRKSLVVWFSGPRMR